VRNCYEAGCDGFWFHRHLVTVGIDNRVVDSSSIGVNRRQRHAKSDGVGCPENCLHVGTVPCGRSEGVECRADCHGRGGRPAPAPPRAADVEEATHPRKKPAQGLLANQGLWLPKGRDLTTFFAEIRLWDGSPVPAGLRARLQREWAHAQFYTQRSVNWSASDRRRSNTTAGRRSKK
jgi:hypothetical protein